MKDGGEEIGNVTGKLREAEENENDEYLEDNCAWRSVFCKQLLSKKMIHRYTWTKGNMKSLIDLIALDERMKREVMDAKIVRVISSCSDHFSVLAKARIRMTWKCRRNMR